MSDIKKEEYLKMVNKCAEYLIAKNKREIYYSKSFYDKLSLLAKLDSAENALNIALKHLIDLDTHFQLGRMLKFDDYSPDIHEMYKLTVDAWVKIHVTCHTIQVKNQPRNRSMELQKSAVRLAYSSLTKPAARGAVRKMSIEIMDKAGIENPDDSTISKWIKEFKVYDKEFRIVL